MDLKGAPLERLRGAAVAPCEQQAVDAREHFLVGELGQWERAVELRRRAASRLGGPVAATWLWEVGAIHERHLGDDEQARQAYEDALARKGCRPMDFTGRPMRGFVFVELEGLKSDKDLAFWLELVLAYNPTVKKSASKK